MKKLARKFLRGAAALEARVRKGLAASAAQTAEMAAGLAPVDSGELRAGIRPEAGAYGAAVISAAPHAAMVEFGTSKAPAQPYMLPAARAGQGPFLAEMRAAAREVLK